MVNFKNSFSILLLIIFFSNLSYSQGFNYSLSFGIGKSSGILSEDRNENALNSEINYNISALVFLPSKSSLRVQTGLKYFNLGYNVDIDARTYILPTPKNIGRNLSFIAIPFNLNYMLPFFQNAYLSGGLEVAYLVSAYSDIVYSKDSSLREDISNQYKDLNLFIALGFGIDIPLNKLTLFFKPEYTRSISNVTDKASFGSASNIETVVLNIGFKF